MTAYETTDIYDDSELYNREEVAHPPMMIPSPSRTSSPREALDLAVDQFKSSWRKCRSQLLDSIYSGGYKERPPCIAPCALLSRHCHCTSTTIKRIGDFTCPCGDTYYACDNCDAFLKKCPTCGRPYRRGSMSGIKQVLQTPRQSSPPPSLRVTAVGPFKEKGVEDYYESPQCEIGYQAKNCILNAAHDVGMSLGVMCPSMASAEPPPTPLPPRPLQKLAPCFFVHKEQPQQQCALGSLLTRKQRSRPQVPPKGGIVGAIEDATAIGMGIASTAIKKLAELIDIVVPQPSVPGAKHCTCGAPALRYPKNGIYSDPVDPPTVATGCGPLDAFNNFMDALTFRRHEPEEVKTIPPAEIPETEKNRQ